MRFQNGRGYARRTVPTPRDGNQPAPQWASRLVSWLAVEFGTVQQAIQAAPTVAVSAAYTAQVTDGVILATATSGAFTVTLPDVAQALHAAVTIKKVDSSANAVTIGGTVDGTSNPTLASQYDAMTVWSDGTTWHKIAEV